MRVFLLVLMFVSSGALAQDGTVVRRADMGWSAATRTKGVTTAALNLFVATTGLDTNTCTTALAPCLTIRGALNKVPLRIAHAVTITVAAGTFVGAIASGFTVESPDPDGASYLLVQGTMIAATVATGTASGTATSGTAVSGATLATLTDTSQAWTVDDLKGTMVYLSAGTGSGETKKFIIVSNTATAITVAGVMAAASGTTYSILDWGTTLTPHEETRRPYSAIQSYPAGFTVAGVSSGHGWGGLVVVAQFKFTYATSAHVEGAYAAIQFQGESTRAEARWNNFSNTGTSITQLNVNMGAGGIATGNYFNGASASSGAVLLSMGEGSTANSSNGMHVVANFFTGLGTQVGGSSPSVRATNNVHRAVSTSAYGYNGAGTAGYGHLPQLIVQSANIDCESAGGAGVFALEPSNAGAGSVIFNAALGNSSISNCANAVNLATINSTAVLHTVSGTGNTNAILVKKGAAVRLTADSTLTGTTEITMESTTSTIAAMRAASPKLVTNTYGTIVYE